MDGGDGDGGGMDPCECVWSHELATRRIINMIRQTQDYCTENECITDNAGDGTGAGADDSTAMFFIGFWCILALFLFFLRPRNALPTNKPSTSDHPGRDYDPPAPAMF